MTSFPQPPSIFVQGPVPIQGLCLAPWTQVGFPPPPQPAGLVSWPPLIQKHKDKYRESAELPRASPPELRVGINYMFPLEHTSLSVFNTGKKIWEEKYEGQMLTFKQYQVDTLKTVKALIESIMNYRVKGDFEKCKGWAATEVMEAGNGKWKKGTTVEYTSDKAKGTLKSMGWSSKRGDALPPVWITVHKV